VLTRPSFIYMAGYTRLFCFLPERKGLRSWRVATSGCDNCYGVCPDNAIIKLGDGQYAIDYDYCKGCGLCAAECPAAPSKWNLSRRRSLLA